jgi:4-oxalocrotonate tautomerase
MARPSVLATSGLLDTPLTLPLHLVGRTTNYIWSEEMPLVNVKIIEGVFRDDQKQEMIEKLTDTMVEIEGENMRGVTWVVVEEVKSGDWGIGGQALTTEAVHALAAGTPA